jgi:hypothetical protein
MRPSRNPVIRLYNFKPRFVEFILSGAKTHTIRDIRKYPAKPGDTLHLYTGLRTKKTKLLLRVRCVKVEEIKIVETVRMGIDNGVINRKCAAVAIDDQWLSLDEQEALARRDGFSDFYEFVTFWDGRLPFQGHIIHWRKL